jgi:hypothetical protein
MTLSFLPDADATALGDAARRAFVSATDPIDAIDGLEVLGPVGTMISLELASVIAREGAAANIDYPFAAAFTVATLLDRMGRTAKGAAELRASLGEVSETGDILVPLAPDTRHIAALTGDEAYLLDVPLVCDTCSDPLKSVAWQRLKASGRSVPGDLRPIAWTLLAAEILGAADRLLERQKGHLKTRKQFGQLLGSFQTLRHRAAADWVHIEDIRVAIDMACVLHDSAAPEDEILAAARIAKAIASDAGPRVAENAIHAHGAMGFTAEAGLQGGLIRIRHASSCLGTASEHFDTIGRRRIASQTENRISS